MTKPLRFLLPRIALVSTVGFVSLMAAFLFLPSPQPASPPHPPQPRPVSLAPSAHPPVHNASLSQPKPSTLQTPLTAATAATPHQAREVHVAAGTPTFTTASGERYPLRTYKTLATNDPAGSQWWVEATDITAAWDIGAGPQLTTVAIIDTGFGLAHEEFAGRWADNEGEQGAASSENPSKLNCSDRSLALSQSCNLIDDDYDGIVDNETGVTASENPSRLNCTGQGMPLDKSCNLIDDDDNGYADDVTGWDFANNDPGVQAGQVDPTGESTGHGTETAGILAATGNNGIGIAGVNWTAGILPLQAIDDSGYGNTLTVARAVYYAADRGVDVISISLGSEEPDAYLRQAVQYALDKGSAVVAASGNDGCNCMSYPANYPEVFAVGSYDSSTTASWFSNYGTNLDILAPGEDITTPTWREMNGTSSYISGISGTSYATPYVSGLLALARSHQPGASWGELENSLLAMANHTGLSISTPWTPQLGSGYARAGSFLARVTASTQPGMRYQLGPLSRLTTLGSDRAFYCRPENAFPTAPLYKITSGGSVSYTIDTLQSVRAASSGGASVAIGRACVGLPGDAPSTLRTVNLFSEIDNRPGYKQ